MKIRLAVNFQLNFHISFCVFLSAALFVVLVDGGGGGDDDDGGGRSAGGSRTAVCYSIWSAHWVSIFIMNHCHRCLKGINCLNCHCQKGGGGGEMSALGEVHWCTGGGGGGERRDH